MALIFGPAEDLGHPFPGQRHEIPRRRMIGNTIVYSFGRPFLYEPIGLEPEEPIEAVAVWDPCWLRLHQDRRGEIERLQQLAADHGAPLVGLFGDWFAGWSTRVGWERFSTPKMLPLFDGVVTDQAGAVSILATGYQGRVVAAPHMLTYGRLPTLGDDPAAVANAATERKREIDVCCISHPHAPIVWPRPFYFDLVRRICRERGWSCVIRDGMSSAHMESLYLRSRVVFNCSLGSQLNCRVYEALAAGCQLLTDGWNLEASTLPQTVATYTSPEQVAPALAALLESPPDATTSVPWILAHGPIETWKRNVEAIRMAAMSAGFNRRAKGTPSAHSSSLARIVTTLPPAVASR